MGSRAASRVAAATAFALAVVGLGVPAAQADPSTPVAVTVTGGAGTVTLPATGAVYAKQGQTVTLGATTDPVATCVDVASGATVLATQTAPAGSSTWTIRLIAGRSDGVQALTVRAWTSINAAGNCNQAGGAANAPGSASYVVDNTGPVVVGTLNPAANAQGWLHTEAVLTWNVTDAGVGLPPGYVPPQVNVNTETGPNGTTQGTTILDALGNVTQASLLVKLDETAPLIGGARSPEANSAGWNAGPVTVSFACTDTVANVLRSGIHTCTPPTTLSREGAGQSVTGTALDNADNVTRATVGGINIDGTPPTLTGAPATAPNAAGWYRDDVVVHWTAADALSGLAAPVPDATLRGEGTDLTATATATDLAGNATTSTISPAVRIDRTPPQTTVQAPPGWVNTDQTLDLTAADNLSGVAATHYVLDNGSEQAGSSVKITTEGDHPLEYWSTDVAGNQEAHHTAHVRIDKSAPTIGHTLDPAANTAGWNRTPVTVTFTCADQVSAVARCSDPQEVSTEGAGQPVTGTATDLAGNSATDPATVNLDQTDPTISGSATPAANANGWNNTQVTVGFSCADALSGVARCSPSSQDVSAEGADQSVLGTAVDAAGNTKTATVGGIKIDLSPPALTGTPTTDPNAAGWYRGDVVVHWTCADALSGLAGPCPNDTTVIGEGGALPVSASVADRAGNVRSATVTGVNIDRSPPSTSVSLPDPPAGGWYTSDVLVTLTALDSLSGVAHTSYRVDGGDAVEYTGPFDFGLRGVHTITYWSADVAGNTESELGHAVTIRIDGNPPTITGSATPAANARGWNNAPVTVSFSCEDAESWITACEGGVTLSQEVDGQSVPGSAEDAARNTQTATVGPIKIDLTSPTLTGKATTDPNAADWYRDDVTVAWTPADGLSGVDPDSVPSPSVIMGEGRDLGTGTVSVSDNAGNTKSASFCCVNIDRTDPVITGKPTTSPGPSGWYTGDVTVAFTCTDARSGVAACPSDKVITGNGADRSVTSDVARDVAGNTAAGQTVGGIDIDGLPPSTTASNTCDGQCTGDSATVELKAVDQPGLSGVKELHYAVNGGSEQVQAGDTTTVTVPLAGTTAKLTYFAVDNAGNAEPVNTVVLNQDNIAPSVTHTIAPTPNAAGWNNSDVTVTFSAKDDDLGSGLDPSSLTPPVTVSDETGPDGKTIVGSALDLAGNRGTDSVVVRLDKTSPSITGAATAPPAASGWYTGPVTIHFTCSDALSGVAVCPDDVGLTKNGANQSVSRTAVDAAGNSRSVTVSGISIDRETPAIGDLSMKDGGYYVLGAVPAATCSATDSVSGPRSCTVAVNGPSGGGVGTYTFTATALDVAGNSATVKGGYHVVYRFDGFSPPIRDFRWFGFGFGFSVFRAGVTVPVRLQLKTASGQVVAGGAPRFVDPVRTSLTTVGINCSAGDDPATPDAMFQWDAANREWVYHWSTRGLHPGYLYRIGATLDDGRTYVAYIGLR